MPVEVTIPAIPAIIITGLVDSINPCAIGVLILLITTLLTLKRDRHKMLLVGLIYVLAVYVAYFVAGLGLLSFLHVLSSNLTELVSVIVGVLVIILGFVEVKDFWWYGKGFTLAINPKHAERIKRMVKRISVAGAILLGVFVAAVELPCTGGPYLAITLALSQAGGLANAQAIWALLLYNVIFVLPLLVILGLVYFGMSVERVHAWKTEHRKYMRLATGIVMIALGVFLILFAKGIIRFGF